MNDNAAQQPLTVEEAVTPAPPAIIEPRGRMRVPVNMFVSPNIMPGANAIDELHELAATEGLRHPIAVMPDVHYKGRNPAPTGVVLAMPDRLVPFAVDKGINCGMRMIRTSLPASACTDAMLDALYAQIQRRVPIKAAHRNVLKKKEAWRALVEGAPWAAERFELHDSELDCIERRGSMFDGMDVDPAEVLRALPSIALKKARRGFGSLGAGNHFLEAQEIVEVLDPQKARLLGLETGNVVFMMHTGSGAVAGQVMRYYSTHARPESWAERLRLDWAKLRFHVGCSGTSPRDLPMIWKSLFAHRRFFTIPAESHHGRNFIHAIYAASNFGFVNRMAITEALRDSVRSTFGDPRIGSCGTGRNVRLSGYDVWPGQRCRHPGRDERSSGLPGLADRRLPGFGGSRCQETCHRRFCGS
ncbi:MAG: RtcB family protein [Candidatus Krumholzibacteriia bacterium]